MPLLLLVSLYEFRQFLQIVLWIAVPATLVAVFLTIFFHYRRKKKREGLELAFLEENNRLEKLSQNPASSSLAQTVVGDHPEGLPDWLASANPNNTPLLKKYEQEVRRYRENYAILEQDFRELEEKYTDLRNKAYRTDKEADITLVAQLQKEIKAYKEKINRLQQATVAGNVAGEEAMALQATIQQLQEDLRLQQEEKEGHVAELTRLEQLLKNMEQSVSSAREDMQQYHSQQVEDQDFLYKIEKERLSEQLQEAQRLLQQLQDENNRLQQLVAAGNTAAASGEPGNDERVQVLQQLLAQAESERAALKEQLAAQKYLPDVLEEKSAHIDFLQHQLEQRIKNYHLLEQQAGESASQLQQLQITVNGFDQQIRQLTSELQEEQQQSAAWQSALEQSRREGQEQEQVIVAKTARIEQLEHDIQAWQEQQQILHTEIAEQQDAMRSLQEHLATEQQKAAALETKLELSSQLLVRIYTELAKSLDHYALVNPEQTKIIAGTAEEANTEERSEVLQLQAS